MPQAIIYTDSKTAMSWVRNKKIKTTLQKNDANRELFTMCEKAVAWLENDYLGKISVVKRDTANW